MFAAVKEEVEAGGRAYIIYPLVSESATELMADVKVRGPSCLLRTPCKKNSCGIRKCVRTTLRGSSRKLPVTVHRKTSLLIHIRQAEQLEA